ncbi:MAG: TetR/AcrR family transcriptional regulator [Cyanothece sp. SIO1E1]|nr:TetR/AcrR family transcriptional regulator [Cyanothece sp. SIO1E1]
MATGPSKTKIKLLQAAAQVVQAKGVAQLTLDAVAQQAQISKGGLLYHYPSKSALLKAMVAYLIENFEQALEQQMQATAGETNWVEAYVAMSFDPNHAQLSESAGILAAVANDPSLMQPLRQQYQTWQAAAEASGLDPNLATIVRLAADGLWFTELFNVSPLTAERRSQVLEALLQLIQQSRKR